MKRMFLATRELFHSKLRYILIGFIIILVASLIFIITGLAKGLSANNASSIEDMNTDYLVIEKDAEQELGKSLLKHDVGDEIKETKDVKDVAPLTVMQSSAKVNGAEKGTGMAFFITSSDSLLLPKIVEGKGMKKETDVILDNSLKKEGLKIDDTIHVGDVELNVGGFAEGQRYSHTSVAYVSEDAFALKSGENTEKVNAFAVTTNNVKQSELQNHLSTYEVMTKAESLKGIPSYSQEQASLNMMIVFLLIIAAFVLAVFFYVMILQKRDQFGVLKALGAKTSYLAKNVISQVFILSVICIGIGVALTYGISAFMPEDMPFVIDGLQMLGSSVLVLAVSLIGAVTSLFQVVKVDPIEAIEGGAK